MEEQIILACDDDGNFLEYIPRMVGHTGEGRRHLAITVLIYNSKADLLLQRRKHKVFDNIWDFTASTHPLHTSEGDESLEQATMRALKDEYGISEVENLKDIGEFNYFSPYHTAQGVFCENEHDHILTGEYNGEIVLNPNVAYEAKWVNKKEALKDIEKNPDKYSAWTKESLKVLKEKGFFNERP